MNPNHLPEHMSDASRRRLYRAGFTDESDRQAPARGLLLALPIGVAFWVVVVLLILAAFGLGLGWPFGDWQAAGSW